VRLSASGVQKILRRHRLGRRAQRVAALAHLTAATSGIVTTQAKDGPFGFCHFAARPGDLVALDTFYVGKLKGIGPVWQLTAVDTATRYAIGALVAGDKSARDAAGFVDHVAANVQPRSPAASASCRRPVWRRYQPADRPWSSGRA